MNILTTILALALSFEGGYIPQAGNDIFTVEDEIQVPDQEFYLQFNAELCFKGMFFIGGNLRTEKSINPESLGKSILEGYGFFCGVRPAEWLEVGFHYSRTEILPPSIIFSEEKGISGDRQEFYVKLHTRFDIIK